MTVHPESWDRDLPCEVLSALASETEHVAVLIEHRSIGEMWDRPSTIEGYSVGELAAHVVLATGRLRAVLGEPPPARTSVVATLQDFYGANRATDAMPAGVHAVLREASAELARKGHIEVCRRFRQVVDGLPDAVRERGPSHRVSLINTPDTHAPLWVYVWTRVVELVVHADDLCCSTGLELYPTPQGQRVALAALLELVTAQGQVLPLIRALARAERASSNEVRVL